MNDFTLLLKSTRKNLMTGVSYMIPFVVAGGILLALSVLLSGGTTVPADGVLADIAQIGITGLGLMVPILSGYIAFSMADRPGLAPGIIGGMLANTIGAGFIGGIISGLLAGTVVYYMKKIKVGPSLRSVMPILIIPLLSTIIVGGAMVWVVGTPIASMMTAMTGWLSGLGTENLAVLGLVLGAMIGFDLGGPINKVAFGFASAMIGTIDPATGLPSPTALAIMAGVGVAICVPPIGMGLATLLAPKKFTTEEHDSGKAAIIMGLVGISEGAIPFASADPMRVIPSNIVGAAVGSFCAVVFGATNSAPWGGWIVAPISQSPFMYIAATLVGAAVTAGMVILLKKPVQVNTQAAIEETEDDDFDMTIEIM